MAKVKKLSSPATVMLGGWYQRTTLHLSEIYDLLAHGTSALPLSAVKLTQLHKSLNIKEVERVAGYMDCVRARTTKGIEIRYYEDGLYVLEMHTVDIVHAEEALHAYLEEALTPAIGYIFSLGAPTPKVVAEIKTAHPLAVVFTSDDPKSVVLDENIFGESYQTMGTKEGVTVHKTRTHIVAIGQTGAASILQDLVEMQIFFREFKDQLAKYLNIHRTIWEDISAIKERKAVKSQEIEQIRSRLDSYQVTVGLIANRINQMGTYVHTRAAVAKMTDLESTLRDIFTFRFEDLENTLEYIKEIWKMTQDFLESAIRVIVELQDRTTQASIQSLRTITTFGVLAGVVQFMWSGESVLMITPLGVTMLVLLLVLAWFVDWSMRRLAMNKSYDLTFSERVKGI